MDARGEITLPAGLVRPRTARRSGAAAALAARVRDLAAKELFVLLALAFFAVKLLLQIPHMVAQDGWLTLVAGREIVERGLPSHDRLTVWAGGAEWVDQQWLAQLVFHGVHAAGGMKLALLANVALLTGALLIAVVAARRLGASPRSVGLVAVPCAFAALSNTVLRAQTLAYPLFVALLWLLVRDARAPSRRVFLFVPLLVLWANLHGSVVFGAGLVALLGVVQAASLVRARRWAPADAARASALVLLPWSLVLASPYGFSLLGYYREMLWNPAFRTFVSEWQASALPDGAPFFAIALPGLWLVARYGTRLSVFERLAFVVLLLGGLGGARYVVWFAFAAAVIVPMTLDALWRGRPRPTRVRINVAMSAAAVAAVAVVLAVTAARPLAWFESSYPPAAASVVAAAAERDPDLTIFAEGRFADWLLWREPALAGRIAFDVRYELITPAQLESIWRFRSQVGPEWRKAADGHRLLVLDSRIDGEVAASLLAERGTRRLYRDEEVTVLLRARGGAA